jgi:hypothetical protein
MLLMVEENKLVVVYLDFSLKVLISQDSYAELIVRINVLHWHLIDRIVY